MTEENARKVANALLAAAAIGAGYVVLKSPPLRRLALKMALTAATGFVPGWLLNEVRGAWAESRESRTPTRS